MDEPIGGRVRRVERACRRRIAARRAPLSHTTTRSDRGLRAAEPRADDVHTGRRGVRLHRVDRGVPALAATAYRF